MMRGTSWGDVGGLKKKNNAPAPIGRARLLFASIFSLLSLLAFPSYQPCVVRGAAILSSSDGEFLLELKHSIVTCDSNDLLSDWNENNSDPCSWSGVRCDPDSRRVVSLIIQGKRTRNAGSNPAHLVDLDDAVHCGRSGTLSPVVGKLSELRRLSITYNRLTGELPEGIAGLKSLQVLDLRSNLLTGQIPSELGKLSNLRVLNLANNAFQGHIPSELSFCHELRHLSLSGNVLSGSIPSLGSLPRLQRLSLSGNNLRGSIPIHLFEKYGGGCTLVYLDLSGNQLGGSIPAEIGLCTQLRWVLLNFNNLVGSIPAELGMLSRLKSLQLAGNQLSGSVPPQLAGCTRLEHLVLTSHHSWSSCLHRTEGNNFLGALPPGLALLPNLRVLWAPGAEGIPETFTDIVDRHQMCNVHFHAGFWMNSRVVSPQAVLERSADIFSDGLVRRKLTDQNSSLVGSDTKGTQKKLNSIFVAAITSGCAIAIVIFSLGIIFQCSRYRKKRPPSPTRQSQRQRQQEEANRKVVVTFMNVHHSLTYDNLVKATGNFSIDNLIGSGGFGATYKAEVKPGVLVAVKRLSIGRFHGAQQFDTEIRTLGRIRHPNLVTLIGYHASRDEMFLVYNFFSQGNLETLIHTHKEQMEWKTRHSIAFRIAEALAFLHDDCVPRVLHRDIKPSNILLDDDLNAHLSDFGLARLLGASETHATTDVAGTFGYVAPEYAMTCRVTDKADVYSYGVVLLELISGKKALDPSFSEYGDGFNIVSWACLLIRQGRAPEVFPAKLWEMGPEKSLLETLKLAVLCTVDQLQIRPTMKEVVDTLGKIRPVPSPT